MSGFPVGQYYLDENGKIIHHFQCKMEIDNDSVLRYIQ